MPDVAGRDRGAARRALAETLPLDVVAGVSDFLTGPLADNPHRVGKPLEPPLAGFYSAWAIGLARALRRR